MLGFVRGHMRNILQPFAENVEELHKSVMTLCDNLQEVRSRVEATEVTVAEQVGKLEGLRTDHEETLKLARSTQDLLTQTRTEKEFLEASMAPMQKVTKAVSSKLDELRLSTQKTAEEIKKNLEDTRVRGLKCQDAVTERQVEIVRTNGNLDRLSSALENMTAAHEKSVANQNSLKQAFENHVLDAKGAKEEQEVRRVKFERFAQDCESKFREIDDDVKEAPMLVAKAREECAEALDNAEKALNGRLDAVSAIIQGVAARIDGFDDLVADSRAFTQEHFENVNKIVNLKDNQRVKEIKELTRMFDLTSTDTSKHSRMLKEINKMLRIAADKSKDAGKNCIVTLEEDSRYALRRCQRIETIMGLPALAQDDLSEDSGLTFLNGILLTETQIEDFRQTFNRYDKDGDGSISADEIQEVMSSLGYEVPEEALAYVVKTIDADNSGEISFDEFCTLMGKMLGPDGKVDVESYMKAVSEDAVREAKQNQVAEMVPLLKDEMQQMKKSNQQEFKKVAANANKLASLQTDHTTLVEEVKLLRKALEVNSQHWKGLSQGLKETSRTVTSPVDGEGEFLPSPTRLREALPPLGMRPMSARTVGMSSTTSTRAS
eukprot:TRINITY_DN63117_c0_g1_i1.p1 TRINITY_DN63117_c0_g1~~TRINITY_DN63117_c0_g1_i1.p1  ORF type:complete len:692 (+),score=171.06 TRINITY_DN63117_c0_g1_i1:266-2077(+)